MVKRGKTQQMNTKLRFTEESDGSGTQLRQSREHSDESSFENGFSDNQMNIKILRNKSIGENNQNADIEVVKDESLEEVQPFLKNFENTQICQCKKHGCFVGQRSRERETKKELLENLRQQNSYKRFTVKCMENLLNKRFVDRKEQSVQTNLDYVNEWINPIYVADQKLYDVLDQDMFNSQESDSHFQQPPSFHSGLPTSKTGTPRTNSIIGKMHTKQSTQQLNLNQDLMPDQNTACLDVQSFEGIFTGESQFQSKRDLMFTGNQKRKIVTDPSKDFLDVPMWMLRNQKADLRDENSRPHDALSQEELSKLIEKKKYSNLTEHLKMINNSRNHIDERVRTQMSHKNSNPSKNLEIHKAMTLSNVDLKINPKHTIKQQKQIIRGGKLVNVVRSPLVNKSNDF